jgi:UDP-N-acetylmuramoyl-tripeptide--D-alanyl-D-alanine ligase
MHLSLQEIAQITGGQMHGPDVACVGVCIDSRRVQGGCLFAALAGARVDGHEFAPAAMLAGAAAVIGSRIVENVASQVIVDDVVLALGLLAKAWRSALDITVLAVTGSNGKTTVKEMLASILRQNHRVLATVGNFNNELGVPLTLFRLSADYGYAVIELGASKPGDIQYLAEMTRPDIGIVNNAAEAHLEGFSSTEGVARAKGELFEILGNNGIAVINGDQQWAQLWQDQAAASSSLRFGFGVDKYVQGSMLVDGSLHIRAPHNEIDLRLPLAGDHNAMNALAATAAAISLGIPAEAIREGLETVQPVPGRLNRRETAGGWTVIDDTYNANPASLYAGLQVLSAAGGETWLVLGDMAELGPGSRKLHAEMGEATAALGIRRLFCTGPLTEATVQTFGRGGMHFRTRKELVAALLQELHPSITCLVKGSRSMGMEEVADALVVAAGKKEAV